MIRDDLSIGTDGRQVVVHVDNPWGQILQVPGVPLYFRDGDALLGLGYQNAAQHVPTFPGSLHLGRDLIVHLQDPLQSTCCIAQPCCASQCFLMPQLPLICLGFCDMEKFVSISNISPV